MSLTIRKHHNIMKKNYRSHRRNLCDHKHIMTDHIFVIYCIACESLKTNLINENITTFFV